MQNAAASYFVVGDNGATRSIDAETRSQLRAAQTPVARLEPVAGSDGIVSPDLELHATIDGADIVCAAETCRGDLRGAQSLPSGDIIFLRLEGFAAAETSLYTWSPRSGRVDQLYTGDARPAGCSAQDSSRIFCLYEDLRTPRRVIVFERADARHQMRTLYEPNPQWADFALPEIERLDFTDQRGLQSYAHLVYPLDYAPGQTYPLVIVQYRSRGFLRGGVGGEHPIYPLASRGYFVLSVERPEDRVRMASVDSRTLEREQELSGEERRMKLDAIDEFLTRLERRGLVDPDRVAITGMSDGAETLFWALVDRRYAAAVTSSPPSDPSAWWLGSARFRQASEQRIGLTPPWDPSRPWARWWRDNNIAAFAPRIRTPILFNLSDAEALTAMPLYVRLREEGQPTEMYVYADSYHLKWRPRQLRAAQSRAIAWIERWTAP
jgi:dipeptidyl aminopeptidase/acylaminoacyl peptidase